MTARGFTAHALFALAALGLGAVAAAAQSAPARPSQSTRLSAAETKGSLVVDFSKPPEAAPPAAEKAEERAEATRPAGHTEPGHVCLTGDDVADAAVREAGVRYGVDPCFVVAVMAAESGYRRYAVSPKGACGYMQLMPETARRFGVTDIFDARQNILAGTRYLRFLLERFGGSLELALAGYNAGEGAVERYGMKIPPYLETQNYVRLITRRYLTRHAGHAVVQGAGAAPVVAVADPRRAPERPPVAWRISVSFGE